MVQDPHSASARSRHPSAARPWSRARGVGAVLGMAICATPVWTMAATGPAPPAHTYYVYAAAESEDEVAIVRYGPGGVEVVETITVGSFPAEVEGPHGLSVDPDGQHWYVSIAHGLPYGSVHKYETETITYVRRSHRPQTCALIFSLQGVLQKMVSERQFKW